MMVLEAMSIPSPLRWLSRLTTIRLNPVMAKVAMEDLSKCFLYIVFDIYLLYISWQQIQ